MKLIDRLLDAAARHLADRILMLNHDDIQKIAEQTTDEGLDAHERNADHLGIRDAEIAVSEALDEMERDGKLLSQDNIDEALKEERETKDEQLLVLARAIQSLIPVDQVEANDALHKLIAELQ